MTLNNESLNDSTTNTDKQSVTTFVDTKKESAHSNHWPELRLLLIKLGILEDLVNVESPFGLLNKATLYFKSGIIVIDHENNQYKVTMDSVSSILFTQQQLTHIRKAILNDQTLISEKLDFLSSTFEKKCIYSSITLTTQSGCKLTVSPYLDLATIGQLSPLSASLADKSKNLISAFNDVLELKSKLNISTSYSILNQAYHRFVLFFINRALLPHAYISKLMTQFVIIPSAYSYVSKYQIMLNPIVNHFLSEKSKIIITQNKTKQPLLFSNISKILSDLHSSLSSISHQFANELNGISSDKLVPSTLSPKTFSNSISLFFDDTLQMVSLSAKQYEKSQNDTVIRTLTQHLITFYSQFNTLLKDTRQNSIQLDTKSSLTKSQIQIIQSFKTSLLTLELSYIRVLNHYCFCFLNSFLDSKKHPISAIQIVDLNLVNQSTFQRTLKSTLTMYHQLLSTPLDQDLIWLNQSSINKTIRSELIVELITFNIQILNKLVTSSKSKQKLSKQLEYSSAITNKKPIDILNRFFPSIPFSNIKFSVSNDVSFTIHNHLYKLPSPDQLTPFFDLLKVKNTNHRNLKSKVIQNVPYPLRLIIMNHKKVSIQPVLFIQKPIHVFIEWLDVYQLFYKHIQDIYRSNIHSLGSQSTLSTETEIELPLINSPIKDDSRLITELGNGSTFSDDDTIIIENKQKLPLTPDSTIEPVTDLSLQTPPSPLSEVSNKNLDTHNNESFKNDILNEATLHLFPDYFCLKQPQDSPFYQEATKYIYKKFSIERYQHMKKKDTNDSFSVHDFLIYCFNDLIQKFDYRFEKITNQLEDIKQNYQTLESKIISNTELTGIEYKLKELRQFFSNDEFLDKIESIVIENFNNVKKEVFLLLMSDLFISFIQFDSDKTPLTTFDKYDISALFAEKDKDQFITNFQSQLNSLPEEVLSTIQNNKSFLDSMQLVQDNALSIIIKKPQIIRYLAIKTHWISADLSLCLKDPQSNFKSYFSQINLIFKQLLDIEPSPYSAPIISDQKKDVVASFVISYHNQLSQHLLNMLSQLPDTRLFKKPLINTLVTISKAYQLLLSDHFMSILDADLFFHNQDNRSYLIQEFRNLTEQTILNNQQRLKDTLSQILSNLFTTYSTTHSILKTKVTQCSSRSIISSLCFKQLNLDPSTQVNSYDFQDTLFSLYEKTKYKDSISKRLKDFLVYSYSPIPKYSSITEIENLENSDHLMAEYREFDGYTKQEFSNWAATQKKINQKTTKTFLIFNSQHTIDSIFVKFKDGSSQLFKLNKTNDNFWSSIMASYTLLIDALTYDIATLFLSFIGLKEPNCQSMMKDQTFDYCLSIINSMAALINQNSHRALSNLLIDKHKIPFISDSTILTATIDFQCKIKDNPISYLKDYQAAKLPLFIRSVPLSGLTDFYNQTLTQRIEAFFYKILTYQVAKEKVITLVGSNIKFLKSNQISLQDPDLNNRLNYLNLPLISKSLYNQLTTAELIKLHSNLTYLNLKPVPNAVLNWNQINIIFGENSHYRLKFIYHKQDNQSAVISDIMIKCNHTKQYTSFNQQPRFSTAEKQNIKDLIQQTNNANQDFLILIQSILKQVQLTDSFIELTHFFSKTLINHDYLRQLRIENISKESESDALFTLKTHLNKITDVCFSDIKSDDDVSVQSIVNTIKCLPKLEYQQIFLETIHFLNVMKLVHPTHFHAETILFSQDSSIDPRVKRSISDLLTNQKQNKTGQSPYVSITSLLSC
ncbi:hypothetical protein DID75_03515 [Candidatus Marinamargulisbacteria bacterium SCGC AG-410-N11]|nr:hypothetical protein DID75_03515 [Candidatus Marinamargulisbacteria bacterium SCGC AG-410-N11]